MAKIMAVVNLTPDSFFAPSRVRAREAGERVRALLDAGADVIDLGAVSTRPGAAPVSLWAEWRRLAPAVRVWDRAVPLSVDTTRAEIVRRALEALPGKTREAVVLFYVEQRPYAEIAQILDIPIGTVMSRLHNGRKRLEQLLRPHLKDLR